MCGMACTMDTHRIPQVDDGQQQRLLKGPVQRAHQRRAQAAQPLRVRGWRISQPAPQVGLRLGSQL